MEEIVLELVGKAAEIIHKGIKHKNTLKNLKSTMKELVPVVEQIKQYHETLDLDVEEMENLKAMMDATQEVIRRFSEVRWWNFCLLPYYQCCNDDEKGQLAMPVFYEIDPSDVKKQSGSYQKAFARHEHGHDAKRLQQWKTALAYVANLSGWDFAHYWYDVDLIQDIVQVVTEKLHQKKSL